MVAFSAHPARVCVSEGQAAPQRSRHTDASFAPLGQTSTTLVLVQSSVQSANSCQKKSLFVLQLGHVDSRDILCKPSADAGKVLQ